MTTLQRCSRVLTAVRSFRHTPSFPHHQPPRLSSTAARLALSSTTCSSALPHSFLQPPARSFATKPPTAEPLQTLDDVTFEWKSPIAAAAQDTRAKRRLESHQRAQAKAERGARRLTERRQREEQRRAAAASTDLRGLDAASHSAVEALTPFLPTQLSSTDLTSLHSLTSPLLANAAQLRSLRITQLVNNYAKAPADTGSAEVQVAVLTERLAAMARHRAERRSDVQAIRSENRLRQRRRKLLKWLRRHNFSGFELMMKDCRIVLNEVDGVGRTEKSGNQAKRPARSG